MNLILRPLEDINDPVWSVIISIIILLIGVFYYVRYIITMAMAEFDEETTSDQMEKSSTIHNGGTVCDSLRDSGESH